MSDFLTRVAQSALGRMPVMRVLGTQRYGPAFDMAVPAIEAEAAQQPERTNAVAERGVEMQTSAEAGPVDRAVPGEEPEPVAEAPRGANVSPRPTEVPLPRMPDAIERHVPPPPRRAAVAQPPSVPAQRPASDPVHAAAETTSPMYEPPPEPRRSSMRPLLQPTATLAEPVATSRAERLAKSAEPVANLAEPVASLAEPVASLAERIAKSLPGATAESMPRPREQPIEPSREQPNARSIASRERSSPPLAAPRERRETIKNVEIAAPSAREIRAETPPAPVIHVTIGRVEVRAASPPPAPPVEPPRPAAPRISLDDYLRAHGRSR